MSREASGQKSVRLGDYALVERLGKGAMGEVWRGLHAEYGFPVAVKLATRVHERAEALASFHAEVRTAGRMEHPNIVRLYDQGTVTERDAESGHFAAGMAYLVMEYVGGPRLTKLCGRLSFAEVQEILLQVLDALAYSHSTGVIHRDIKPSNILRSADGASVKVVDFGVSLLAASWDEVADSWTRTKSVSGTPTYMAPEQVRGEHRAIGPQTDLYAVGCLAYALITGTPPFGQRGKSSEDVMREQLHSPIPPLPDPSVAPPEFMDWLRKLLEKDAGLRAHRAAGVANALRAMRPPKKGATASSVTPPAVVDTVASDTPVSSLALPRGSADGVSVIANLLAPFQDQFPVAPVPEDWRTIERPLESLPQGAFGASIFGVRRMPLVGRDREKQVIWDALRGVLDRGRMQVVILEGDDGLGKAALADWAAERCDEVGATHYALISHAAPGASDGGVTGMVSRMLRATHMPPRELSAHITGLMRVGRIASEEDAEAIYGLLAPGHAWREERKTAFASSVSTEERYALATRVLQSRFDTRPLILVVEDVHHGLDALGYIRFLIDTELDRDLPLLVLATVRAEGLEADNPVRRFLNEQVVLHPRCTWLQIDRLGLEATTSFLDEMLPLEPSLRRALAEHSGGSPSFARQLLQGLIDRDAIVADGPCYRLKPSVELKLPADTRALWDARALEVLDDADPQDGVALEIGAILGHQVSIEEWGIVCALSEVEPSAGMLHTLADRGAIRLNEDLMKKHFTFLGSGLRSAILRRAYAAGRTASHHQHAAVLLRRKAGSRGRERLGRHLVGAGHLAAAIAPLSDAAQARQASADYWEAGALVNQVLGLMEEIALPPADPWWAHALLMAAELASERFDYVAAEERASQALQWADENERPLVRAKALRISGLLDLHASRFSESVRKLSWAADHFESVSDMDTALEARAWVIYALDVIGERRQGLELAAQCIRISKLLGHDEQICRHSNLLALLSLNEGRVGQASEAMEQAAEVAKRLGKPRWLAVIHNTSGEIARYRGRYEKADKLYGEAARYWSLTGLGRQRWAILNQGLARASMRQFKSARERVDWVLRSSQSSGDSFLNCLVHAALVWVTAGEQRWEEMQSAMEIVNTDTAAGEWSDIDLATCLEGAGLEAMRHGRHDDAETLLARALDTWRALGRGEDASRLRGLLMETDDDTL